VPERADVVSKAASEVGYLDNTGYDQPNKFSTFLGLPGEAWCGDFVTAIYKMCGLPLPSMQAGHRTGYSYVPDGWAYAGAHGATKRSWEAQPGDIVIFDWSRRCAPGTETHTGLVQDWAGGTLNTIEGNSAPDGGVNRHHWPTPQGEGNAQICGVIDASKLVKFASGAPSPHTVQPPPFPATC
jgi:hypothetical protein